MAAEQLNEPTTLLGKLKAYWRFDILSGFLVFLIALPLCLAISLASGYPAIAGVYTAIIGGLLTSLISNSELTIKGPAAGLIPIALGAVIDLGSNGTASSIADLTADQIANGYRLALGVGVVAGVIQILFGIFHFGRLGDFFPLSAVHGMLAAIGIIIIAKQFPLVMGITDKSASGGPIELISRFPDFVANLNPEIALIGVIGLIILFGMPFIRSGYVRKIPGPMLVLVVSLALSFAFTLTDPQSYVFNGKTYQIVQKHVITLPKSIADGFTLPDFSGVTTSLGIKYIVMFCLIGTLESMLSAKAIDLIDPKKRKTNLDRDLFAVGLANTGTAFVGGLPMISEIVRSRANLDNGARSRWSDAFHSIFLLLCVALFSDFLHHIPMAALGAMLCYTGFRLGSPREFVHVWKIGWEQFAIFCTTVVVTLATDLLIGIFSGIAAKFLLHAFNGVPLSALFLFRSNVDIVPQNAQTVVLRVHKAAVFSNWLGIKSKILAQEQYANVILDLSDAKFVDHSVMEKLHEMSSDFKVQSRELTVVGLESHKPLSKHPTAARSKIRQSPFQTPAGTNGEREAKGME